MKNIRLISVVTLIVLYSVNTFSQQVAINEVMTSNKTIIPDEDGDYEDWVELYNYGVTSVDLEGFGLTDDATLPYKWVFPSIIIEPGEFVLVWASSKDKVTAESLHANFKISSDGEAINLTNRDGELISESPSLAVQSDISFGRQPDGTGSWMLFEIPTPKAANLGEGIEQPLNPPIFSHESGLYTNAFSLELSTDEEDAVIIYTLDGSEPEIENLSGTEFKYKNQYGFEIGESTGALLTETFISNTYTTPLSIYDRSAEDDKLAIKNTVQFPIFIPPTSIRKATVIKARTFLNGKSSKTVAKTFFVWGEGNPYDIPVISLQTQENYLFDYNIGVYTSGIEFDTWRENNPENNQAYRPENNNYWRSGSDWEYPVSIELFDATNLSSVMNTFGGVRIHGNYSRSDIIKNLRLYAKSKYDEDSEFKHDLFDQTIPGAVENNKFKRILLRGNGSGGYIANDVVFSKLMQPIFNGIGRTKAAVEFLNGEYWGLTSLRDRIDKYHFENNFDLDPDNIVSIECKVGRCDLDEGEESDLESFEALVSLIVTNDLSDNNNYKAVTNILDIDSFINHIIIEIFSENDSYEATFWKVRTPENTSQGDGKWRLIVQDFEATLKSEKNWLSIYANTEKEDFTGLLGKLLTNDEFKIKFINRCADVLNTAFSEERFSTVVNQTFDEIAPYLAEDRNRATRNNFYEDIHKETLLEWIKVRPSNLRDQMTTFFEVSGLLNLDLNISDPKAGYIKINTINIVSETIGVNENPYPWTGVYFQNTPITVEGIAYPGYVFSHWSGANTSTSSIIEISASDSLNLQANYTLIESDSIVAYFWLFDSNLENDTPFQNLASTYSSTGVNATLNFSSSLEGYPFSSDDVANWRRASLERTNKPTSLNYREIANNNIAYNKDDMKGLQMKQPFKVGNLENTLELSFSTINLEDIKLSMAIKSNGAADALLIDYWNASSWVTTNISESSLSISEDYEIKEIDFTNVSTANNNANFKVRIRFNGHNMLAEEGDKVYLNNIAIEGVETTLFTEKFYKVKGLNVYPNPTKSVLKITANQVFNQVFIYNFFGQLVYEKSLNKNNLIVDIGNLSNGVYLLKVFSKNATTTEKIIKK